MEVDGADSWLSWLQDVQTYFEHLEHTGVRDVPRIAPPPKDAARPQRGRADKRGGRRPEPPRKRGGRRGALSPEERARPAFSRASEEGASDSPSPRQGRRPAGPTWSKGSSTWSGEPQPRRSLGDIAADVRAAMPGGDPDQLVMGFGNPKAPLVMILQSPGPAVARLEKLDADDVGRLVTQIIRGALEMEPAEVYVTHVVKRAVPGGGLGPPAERRFWRDVLLDQIRSLSPRLIVAFGEVPARALLGVRDPIEALEGRWTQAGDTPVMPTFGAEMMLEDRKYKQPVYRSILSVKDRLRAIVEGAR